jgi:DNA-binding transcriptional regulator YiaG
VRTKSFADQIRAQREAEQLSQSEAAAEWGVSLKTLQNWEQGEREPGAFLARCILFSILCRKKCAREWARVKAACRVL